MFLFLQQRFTKQSNQHSQLHVGRRLFFKFFHAHASRGELSASFFNWIAKASHASAHLCVKDNPLFPVLVSLIQLHVWRPNITMVWSQTLVIHLQIFFRSMLMSHLTYTATAKVMESTIFAQRHAALMCVDPLSGTEHTAVIKMLLLFSHCSFFSYIKGPGDHGRSVRSGPGVSIFRAGDFTRLFFRHVCRASSFCLLRNQTTFTFWKAPRKQRG